MSERSAWWTRWAGAAALAASVGCGGGPEPLPPPKEERPAEEPPERHEPPGVLAPVDAWKAALEERLPAPWRVEGFEAQVVAPPGWTRLRGTRGLALDLTDGATPQRFWIMPAGWEGERGGRPGTAHELARNEEFILFGPEEDAAGWNGTAEVKAALGF